MRLRSRRPVETREAPGSCVGAYPCRRTGVHPRIKSEGAPPGYALILPLGALEMGAQLVDRAEPHGALRQLRLDRSVGVERAGHAVDHARLEDRNRPLLSGWRHRLARRRHRRLEAQIGAWLRPEVQLRLLDVDL